MGILRWSKIVIVLAVVLIILQFFLLSLYQKRKNATSIEISQESDKLMLTVSPRTPTRNVETVMGITPKIPFSSASKGSVEENRPRQEQSER